MALASDLILAVGLGLLGFVEPCAVGSHLIFVKYLEDHSKSQQIKHTLVFTLTRAGFMALLGVLAALLGSRFAGLQHGLWAALGAVYVALGAVYVSGGGPWLIGRLNAVLPHFRETRGSVALGVAFGLNIPACAVPLLAVLLGNSAARAASGAGVGYGAGSLLVFGLALSSPLVLAVFTPAGRRLLLGIARLAGRMPRWTGVVLVLLGLWSVVLSVRA